MADLSNYTISNDTPINKLDCTEAFLGLSHKEKLYAHHLGQAGWEGALICLAQTSPESPGIFLLLQQLFSGQNLSSLRETATNGCGLSNDDYNSFLMYAAAFYSNLGNYKSFGDTKFIPNLPCDKLHALILGSEAYKKDEATVNKLWKSVCERIYSLEPAERQLGFPPEGLTTYYSGNCTKGDAQFINDFMLEKNLSPYNTRVFKREIESGGVEYELRLASSVTSADPIGDSDTISSLLGPHQFRDVKVVIQRGDYSPLMSRVIRELTLAKTYAANTNETNMLEHYILSFSTGSVEEHKEGSRYWIKNKGPVVETYIGFIESYRDPFGVRGEYEGFVAVVNKTMSAKFSQLVESAEQFLPLLPWPKEFEKDTFLRPDFTSLDVLAYGSSGIPAGINIPNYDDIRQNEGFKNVSLGNVLSAAAQDKRVSFIAPEDQELFVKLRSEAFEVQVGLHELLGHGSGKLFKQEENGEFNFDISSIKNPITGDKITSWYKAGDTWDTKFSVMASTYEECRAECVGIYLCTNRDILRIFGHEGKNADDIIYVNWLNMVRAGLMGLEFYTPETQKWRQAHMQGRYVIMRVLMECATPLFSINVTTGSDGKPDLVIQFDRSKLETVGRPAIGEFLKKLQVCKSLADVVSGQQLYNSYSTVTPQHLALRDIVMARKLPRRMFVQPHTFLDSNGQVTLSEFDDTAEGIISSFMARYPIYDKDVESIWLNDIDYWK